MPLATHHRGLTAELIQEMPTDGARSCGGAFGHRATKARYTNPAWLKWITIWILMPLSGTAAAIVRVDFDVPRTGPICVVVAPGDEVVFHWSEAHNLYKLPSKNAFDSCDIGSAAKLANAGPNDGVTVSLPAGADQFFACSKICESNGHKVRLCVRDGSDTAGCDCGPNGRLYVGSVSRAIKTPCPGMLMQLLSIVAIVIAVS